MGELLVGTASWTDKSLLQSGWYPAGASSAEERLRYYASQFPLVEVDSSYYFLPRKNMAEVWVERTPAHFTFNIKAFSLLTQHPTKIEAVPEELRGSVEKKRLYLGDLEPKAVDAVWDMFLDALVPLADAGKLGALLFQFPPWFTLKKANKQYILDCAKRVEPWRICVEFRNTSWLNDDNRKETLDFLEAYDLPFVCVDMPQGFKSSVPPIVAATSNDLAVMRFHGHNADEWESGSVQRRFAYLYSEKELKKWVPKLEQLAADAAETHVLMNNCHSDYAQRNGQQLATLLEAAGDSVR
jgi:uncharacterized protein YecE (DUF72 family)